MLMDRSNQTLNGVISERIQGTDLDSISTTEWERLVHKAHVEGVAPLLYWTLSKSGNLSNLPEEKGNFLKALYANTWLQNQQIFEELKILAWRFHQADIPIVVIKGVCYALTIYPDIGLRPMGDIDLLVPESKLIEASVLAQSLGYVETIPDASPGLTDLLNHEIFLYKKETFPIAVEIHRSLVADRTYSYAVPVDWFWEQTAPMGKHFENLLILTPTAQLLYAAGHAMLQHGGARTPLRWYYDLDRLIHHYYDHIDWDLLLSKAYKFEWSSALEAALKQTSTHFNTFIPDNVLVTLSQRPDRHRKLVTMKQTKPATHILEEWQKILSLNWHGRIRLLLALIFPSPAYMHWRYQTQTKWSLPKWYLFRWWGIIKDAFRTVIVLSKRSRII